MLNRIKMLGMGLGLLASASAAIAEVQTEVTFRYASSAPVVYTSSQGYYSQGWATAQPAYREVAVQTYPRYETVVMDTGARCEPTGMRTVILSPQVVYERPVTYCRPEPVVVMAPPRHPPVVYTPYRGHPPVVVRPAPMYRPVRQPGLQIRFNWVLSD